MKYIYLKTKEIIDTKTDIPSEMWERKGLLPYEIKYVTLEIGADPVKEGFETFDDKVIETKIRWIKPKPVLTVTEYIEKKVEQSKLEVTKYIEDNFSSGQQRTAESSLRDPVDAPYTPEEANGIITFCRTKVKNFINWKNHIRTLTTKEDVDSCNWRTVNLDEDGFNIVSEIYWGE